MSSDKIAFNSGLNIGLFGGTFDPIHNGHLHVIKKLVPKFDLLMLIPAATPQLRDKPSTSAAHRLEMCEQALLDLDSNIADKVVISDIEIQRKGNTYTYDTLQELRAFFPQDSFTLIIGSDAAQNFENWKRAKDIIKMAKVLVVKRPNSDIPGEKKENKFDFEEIKISALDISATKIREQLANSKIPADISTHVAKFIKNNNLYKENREKVKSI